MSGSNEPIKVDTEMLKQAAYNLLQVQQHVQSAAGRLRQECNHNSDAIGDDKTGKEFHEKYDDNQEALIDSAFQSADLVEKTSDEVRKLIHALGNVEQNSIDAGRRLTSENHNG